MTLSPEQLEIAAVIGYCPLDEDEGAEPADLEGCRLLQDVKDGWPIVRWRGEWFYVPTMGQVEEWTFDSVCETPDGDTIEPDHPQSWLSLLGLI